ncbi:MAG: hypothetical protein Q4E07_06950, partial [Eubacteriales bacterium]|nr:hypothetical protein [Eubacteriales bacterium]
YNQEIYNEQSNYMQETYPAPTNEEPPRRNRRMDRRKQRYSFFQKTKEADSKESAFNNPVIPENYRYIDRETSFDLDRHYKDEQ